MKWGPKTMHFFCFFHIIVLIVKEDLEVLSLKTLPSSNTKELFLGFSGALEMLIKDGEKETEVSSRKKL